MECVIAAERDGQSRAVGKRHSRHAIVGHQEKIVGAAGPKMRQQDLYNRREFDGECGCDGTMKRLGGWTAQPLTYIHAAASRKGSEGEGRPASVKRRRD